jgi:hypothetical protein
VALLVLTTSYLALNSVDRSTWTSKVELAVEVEEKDVTTFASAGWKAVTGGLKSAGLSITFKNDVADDSLDETMWALLGTTTAFEVRATSAAVGTSNPKYTGSVLINKWVPVSGSPGDVNEASFTYPTSGTVTRGVS